MRSIILIAHNLRSSHNVGSLLRTADGLGVSAVYLTGYTPHPLLPNDRRLPHLAAKTSRQIAKTALGSQDYLAITQADDPAPLIDRLRRTGYVIYGLEQTAGAQDLLSLRPAQQLALVVGNEVTGLPAALLALCDHHLAIPMLGRKESFNVVQAAAMALFHCRFAN